MYPFGYNLRLILNKSAGFFCGNLREELVVNPCSEGTCPAGLRELNNDDPRSRRGGRGLWQDDCSLTP